MWAIWSLVACPTPTTVFLTVLGAYSPTANPNCAGTSRAMPRACPSLSVPAPSLLTKVCSTAAVSGAYCRRISVSWTCRDMRRAAMSAPEEWQMPLATCDKRLPSTSITPQPRFRNPGSIPNTRICPAPLFWLFQRTSTKREQRPRGMRAAPRPGPSDAVMHKLHKDYAKSLACQHNGSGIPAAQTRGFRTQHSFIKEHDNVRHRHHPPLGVPPARGSCPNDPRVCQLERRPRDPQGSVKAV